MKKILFSFVFIFVLLLQSTAQISLPDKCEAFRPKLLQEKYLKEADLNKFMKYGNYGQNDAPSQKKHWYVFSDRSGNKLYSAPNGSVIGSLDFNERVIIAKISEDWALVYDDPIIETFPLISNKAKAKGWIKMENLLLWDKAISNDAKIINKALLVYNLDENRRLDQHYYSNPATNASMGKYHAGMDYYFVFKYDKVNNMVLLAKQSDIDGVKTKLHGWFPNQSYIPWNQRSCIEPNWDRKAIEGGLQEEIVHVYKDVSMQMSLVKNGYGAKNDSIAILEHKNPAKYSRLRDMEYRMPRYALRYPILENNSQSNTYKCTAFASIGGSMEEAMKMDAWIREMKEKMINSLSTVNLILIIDGTSSMKDYFHYVKQAIDNCKYFTKDYTFKVGLVIYRDYPDGEEGLYEYLSVREKDDYELCQYLENVGKYGPKSDPSDRTSTEALYKGLEIALDKSKMGYNDKENVVFVVIGDCGNAPDDKKSLSQDEIIARMVKSNVNLLTFQVRRPDSPAYSLFNTQMSKILSSNVRTQYRELGLTKASDIPIVKVENGYDLKLTSQLGSRQYKIASMRYAPVNGEMSPNELAELLDEQFGEYVKILGTQMDGILDNVDQFHKFDTLNINKMTDYEKLALGMDTMNLINSLPGGYEEYKILKTTNQLLAYTGYTLKTSKGGRSYWKPVAFLSESEFDVLMSSLSKLYEASKNWRRNPGAARERYVAAMKELTRSLLPGISHTELELKGVEDIMDMINGLNERSDALKKHTIKDLSMPEKVSDEELGNMLGDFTKKYTFLQMIREDYYFTFLVNDTKYYWLPIELLP